jgi:hypothetical protein
VAENVRTAINDASFFMSFSPVAGFAFCRRAETRADFPTTRHERELGILLMFERRHQD